MTSGPGRAVDRAEPRGGRTAAERGAAQGVPAEPHGGLRSANRGETSGAGTVGLSATATVAADLEGGRPRIRWTQAWPIVLRPTGERAGAPGPRRGWPARRRRAGAGRPGRDGCGARRAQRGSHDRPTRPRVGARPLGLRRGRRCRGKPGMGAGTDRRHRRGGLPDVAADQPRRRGPGDDPGGGRARPPRRRGWPLPRAARRVGRRQPAPGPHDAARRRRPRAVRAGRHSGRPCRRDADPRRRGTPDLRRRGRRARGRCG